MSAPLSPIPQSAAFTEQGDKMSSDFFRWLYEVWLRVRSNVATVGSASKPNQSGALVTTTVYSVVQNAVYQVSWYLRITTPAGVSSVATVTIGWREGGVTQSSSGAAVTGNTTTTTQSGVLLVRADSGTNITEAVAYASVGAPQMVYSLDVTVTLVN